MKFQNLSDSEFAEKLVNSLPGIFYLYEKVGDQVLLRRWNTNHVKDLGYSNEKLLNMSGSEFFTKQEFKRINKAIEQVFIKGTAHIKTKIVTKSGKQIPYLLEAYSFVDNDRYYMMGVGIDITSQMKNEKNLKKTKIEKHKLENAKNKVIEQWETKKRELITTTIDCGRTNEIINFTINELNKISDNHPQNELLPHIDKIRTNLKLKINEK